MQDLVEVLTNDPNSREQSFRKGDIIQRANDAKAATVYVKRGLLRSYIIDSHGKEHIFMFACEGWIMADLEAIEYHQPIQLYIDCLEDSEVIFFDNEALFKGELTKKNVKENAQLLYRRIGRLQHRVLMLLGAPAVDRYKDFLKTYPELPNRVPQKMIASFLGIAPQTLSTLRAEMHKVE